MNQRILKIKDWLKFKEPDYEGYLDHLDTWKEQGVPYTLKDMDNLALNYGIDMEKVLAHTNSLFEYENNKKSL